MPLQLDEMLYDPNGNTNKIYDYLKNPDHKNKHNVTMVIPDHSGAHHMKHITGFTVFTKLADSNASMGEFFIREHSDGGVNYSVKKHITDDLLKNTIENMCTLAIANASIGAMLLITHTDPLIQNQVFEALKEAITKLIRKDLLDSDNNPKIALQETQKNTKKI
jgi:hypothetical protein